MHDARVRSRDFFRCYFRRRFRLLIAGIQTFGGQAHIIGQRSFSVIHRAGLDGFEAAAVARAGSSILRRRTPQFEFFSDLPERTGRGRHRVRREQTVQIRLAALGAVPRHDRSPAERLKAQRDVGHRDLEHIKRLERLGYRVLVIWECASRKPAQAADEIAVFFESQRSRFKRRRLARRQRRASASRESADSASSPSDLYSTARRR